MVIHDFDVIAMAVAPDEADPPLIVDANGVLSFSVAPQGLQLIAGRRGQDAQLGRGMQLQQLPQRNALEGSEAPGVLIVKKLLRFLRREALNHTPMV
jgi:hypothetical protein